ncbi:hypothetical protein BDW71DRAFT_209569 [Aspergillus fruticulosus]
MPSNERHSLRPYFSLSSITVTSSLRNLKKKQQELGKKRETHLVITGDVAYLVTSANRYIASAHALNGQKSALTNDASSAGQALDRLECLWHAAFLRSSPGSHAVQTNPTHKIHTSTVLIQRLLALPLAASEAARMGIHGRKLLPLKVQCLKSSLQIIFAMACQSLMIRTAPGGVRFRSVAATPGTNLKLGAYCDIVPQQTIAQNTGANEVTEELRVSK